MEKLFYRTPLQNMLHKIRWGDLAQIVSAAASTAAVIFLAVQITENTKALRSQAHFNGLSLGQRSLELLIEHDSLDRAVSTCAAAADAVSADNWNKCLNYYLMSFNAFEYWYYQHADGSLPDYLWTGADTWWKSQIETNPAIRRFWEESKEFFDDPFRSYISRQFADKSGSTSERRRVSK
jgi:hypothetical protein